MLANINASFTKPSATNKRAVAPVLGLRSPQRYYKIAVSESRNKSHTTSATANHEKIFLRAKTHFLKNTDLNSVLEPEPEHAPFTGTKVVITIGPSCHDVESLAPMLQLGVAACRVDLTWGPLEFHRKSLLNMQQAMKRSRRLCATVVDTLGRELMIRRQVKIGEDGWPIHEESFVVKSGQEVIITTRSDVAASANVLPITYSGFTNMAEKGDTIYIGRYLVCGADSASLYLEVVRIEGPNVYCVAKNDAVLDGLLTVFHAERSQEGLSNVQNTLPLLSQYDRDCIKQLAQEFDIDFISTSYTREAEDVKEARRFLDSIGLTHTKILAKVESRQALLNFYGILKEADGIIISRGNLGLDCLPEKMALVQKTLIQACNLVGKPVLITRVVDTMVNTPRPTRAEATDVANAVLDGLDGILLGAETLRGKYPLETINTISSICRSAEKVFDHHYHFENLMEAGVSANGASMNYAAAYEMDSIVPISKESSVSRALGGSSSSTDDDVSPNSSVDFYTTDVQSGGGRVALPSGPPRIPPPAFHSPYVSKLESIASSAVRAADKVGASLIVVYTHTGKTAQLVAKYRPPMPILTLVVPHLVSDQIRWKLEGRSNARQCLINRGMLPVLAAPSPSGDALLEEAIAMSLRVGLVTAGDHVVCIQRLHEDFCVKILSVDDMGAGIKRDQRQVADFYNQTVQSYDLAASGSSNGNGNGNETSKGKPALETVSAQ